MKQIEIDSIGSKRIETDWIGLIRNYLSFFWTDWIGWNWMEADRNCSQRILVCFEWIEQVGLNWRRGPWFFRVLGSGPRQEWFIPPVVPCILEHQCLSLHFFVSLLMFQATARHKGIPNAQPSWCVIVLPEYYMVYLLLLLNLSKFPNPALR